MWFRGRSGGGGATGADAAAATLAELRAYWEGLRDGPALPRREALDPRGMAGVLEHVFIAERIGPGLARLRLAGMAVNELAGTEARGLPLSVLFEPGARLRLAAALEGVFTARHLCEAEVTTPRGPGRAERAGRLLLMPLVSTRGMTDLCLGGLALPRADDPRRATGRTPAHPARLAIRSLTETPLAGDAPDHHPALRPALRLAAAAEGAVPFRGRPGQGTTARPALRVISGGQTADPPHRD